MFVLFLSHFYDCRIDTLSTDMRAIAEKLATIKNGFFSTAEANGFPTNSVREDAIKTGAVFFIEKLMLNYPGFVETVRFIFLGQG